MLQKIANYKVNANQRPRPIPQAFGSFGGHVGIGSMLTRAAVTLFWVEAEEVWVEATAPVKARTTTNARMIVFIVIKLFVFL